MREQARKGPKGGKLLPRKTSGEINQRKRRKDKEQTKGKAKTRERERAQELNVTYTPSA